MSTRATAVRLVLCASIACGPPGDPEGEPVGAILPFTGDLAAAGPNLEHALFSALDRINEAGGVNGRRLRLVTRDTRSDPEHGLVAARELIEDENVVALIGPEDAELAPLIAPLLREHGVLMISGGATSVAVSTDTPTWFRIVPATERVGAALGERAVDAGADRVGLIFVDDPFGRAFADVVRRTLVEAGRTVIDDVRLYPGETEFSEVIRPLAAEQPDAVVLIAYPTTGALVLADWAASGVATRWYFAPSLRADDFVQNVAPGMIEGAVGVSVGLPADQAQFASSFEETWDGETPQTNAYFYFDALVISALAAQAASIDAGGFPDRIALGAHVRGVSAPEGQIVTWQDIGRALELVGAGGDIDYRGASGSVDFGESGDVTQALIEFWTVDRGEITRL